VRSQQQPTPSVESTNLLLPRGRRYDPYEHADLLGLQVLLRPIAQDELVLDRKYKTIVVCSDLRGAHRRTALAHGIGHWELHHPDDRPKYERQADAYASLYLVHPEELREALRGTDDHRKVAGELGITERLLRAFLAASARS
jgi:Zn-dependent peptidase ImmA (M78 family)